MNATEQELLDAELTNLREKVEQLGKVVVEQVAEMLRLGARVTALEEMLEGALVGTVATVDGPDYEVTVIPWTGAFDD